jgi:transketolase
MARLNTLYMISRAGSGHIGSSFSSLDILSWLYLSVLQKGDRFFSSKGHDSPGLYSVQVGLGLVPFDMIHQLRRLGGLPGHPDVSMPGAVTNTGSLGMGVSKAKGFIFADDLLGKSQGKVFVMTGDGELQEGQFWESLITAGKRNDSRLVVIVDHNKVQSDTRVSEVSDLGDLEAKFKAFDWEVFRIDGHDYDALEKVFSRKGAKPMAIIADTVKGKGVSFMEHTRVADNGYYKYHSGAPSRPDYLNAVNELWERVNTLCTDVQISVPEKMATVIDPLAAPANAERMIPAYTEAILKEADAHSHLVALDADLILDTGLIPFKEKYAKRFVECGIAEQDMVSQAGTMALAGVLPVVHSFACFLTGRASEQIYNNCTQRKKVIYVGSLAGLLPAGPGHSHQAVRDVATMASMPEMVVIEPLNATQVKDCMEWAVNHAKQSVYLRLTSIPYSRKSAYDSIGPLQFGQGHVLRDGRDAFIVTNGPILTNEVLDAADLLQEKGVNVKIIGTPWLNSIDIKWFAGQIGAGVPVVTVENHNLTYGFGNWFLGSLLAGGLVPKRALSIGVEGVPKGGRNAEVLAECKLDAAGLTDRILSFLER